MYIFHYPEENIQKVRSEFKNFFNTQILKSVDLVLVDDVLYNLYLSREIIDGDTVLINSKYFSAKIFHLVKNNTPKIFNLDMKQYFSTNNENDVFSTNNSSFKIYISSDEDNYIILSPI